MAQGEYLNLRHRAYQARENARYYGENMDLSLEYIGEYLLIANLCIYYTYTL